MQRKYEFYGPIKRIRIVKDLSGKSRGYAFIEYEHKSDFSNAYKRGDRERIDDKIVYTDFERGRTEKGFKSRRFGGHFPQETRTLAAWLQKDLKNFMENYPEIVEDIKIKYAPVKENKEKINEKNNDFNKENYENQNKKNDVNTNIEKSRSRSRDREYKDKDKERARKHKSRSRSRSKSRDKRRNKRNLSPTPKKEINNNLSIINNNENIEENINNVSNYKDHLNVKIENNNYGNQNGNSLEGGEINDAGNNGNHQKGEIYYLIFLFLHKILLIFLF